MNTPVLRFPDFSDKWHITKLGDVSSNITYGLNASAKKFDGKHKYLRITDIDDESGSFKPSPLTSPDIINLDEKNKLKPNDICFARTGASVGKSYLYNPKDGLLFHAGFLIKFSINDSVNSYFIRLLVQRTTYWNWVQTVSARSGQPGINAEEYKSFTVYLPSILEQNKIADFLLKVDTRITFLKEKKTLLEQYKKAAMHKIFSQELRFKDENGNQFPEWKRWKLNDLGKTFNGLTGKSGTDFGEGKRYIQYKQIFDNSKINLQHCKHVNIGEDEQQNDVAYGDVFFTTSSETPHEVGMSSVMLDNVQDVYLNSFCFGYRFTSLSDHSPEFYRFYFRSSNLRKKIVKLAQGSTRYNISKSGFLNLSIDVPHIKEQRKIALFLTSLEEKIEVIQDEIQELKLWQKGLLQQMFV